MIEPRPLTTDEGERGTSGRVPQPGARVFNARTKLAGVVLPWEESYDLRFALTPLLAKNLYLAPPLHSGLSARAMR